MPLEPISIGVEVGVELFTKVAPTGFAWIATKAFGVTMLVIGERRSGKSSFVIYLEFGVLFPEGRKISTLKDRNTASFDLTVGREKSLRMRVRRATDAQGQLTVKDQIQRVTKGRPTVLMIFLDVSRDWTVPDDDYGSTYLKALLDELNTKSTRAKGVSARLRHLCIVLNKADLIDATEYQTKVEEVKGILQQFRSPYWGPGMDDIAIYRCIAVENAGAISALDAMIKSIMVSVST
jgi:hypothetical protein